MNLHEYQAKEILQKYGIPMVDYRVISSKEEAERAVEELGITKGVVKIMVHAGGRGKAGGVKLCEGEQSIIKTAVSLVGMKMVNNQTGPEGVVAHKVMIAPTVNIVKQFYLGCIIDRARGQATIIASPEGGMEIEEVAEKSPEKIMTVPIRYAGGLRQFQLANVAKFMGWTGDLAKQGMKIVAGVAKAFMETDASLLEINPLVLDDEGQLVAVDAKLAIDDNALFRRKDIAEMYDPTQVPSNEAAAAKHDLQYIALDGTIGCMVNGAGLAMATMDIIQHYGAKPANFLDVGGSATKEKVAEGFKIILNDPQVKGILVNIFGGIMNCATLAEGVVAAVNQLHLKVPLVVRMEGTNVKRGKEILAESKLNIITADELADAAKKIVAAASAK